MFGHTSLHGAILRSSRQGLITTLAPHFLAQPEPFCYGKTPPNYQSSPIFSSTSAVSSSLEPHTAHPTTSIQGADEKWTDECSEAVRAGFRVIEDPREIPRPLQAERAVGNVVAALVARDECVAMILQRH